MMWRSTSERLALLELIVRGRLPRRRSQAVVWDALAELPWTKRTGRRDELGLVESRRSEFVELLTRVWPEWGEGLTGLTAHGLPPTPDGWAALEDAQRAEGLPSLPRQINRRTAAALGDIEATHDGSVRIRLPKGFMVRTPRGALDLSSIAAVLGEVSLPERTLNGGFEFEGPVHAVLLVENLGAFCDLAALDGWLFAHVAGWDTATVMRFLERLVHIPVVHFGDLDPNGVRIFQHLRRQHAELRWFVPPFWEESVKMSDLHVSWPDDLDLRDALGLVQWLAEHGRWLEQEPLAVDPRTPMALEAML